MKRKIIVAVAALSMSAALLPGGAAAQALVTATTPDAWQFQGILYGYFPTIGSTATFPNGATGDISVSANQILDALQFGALGTFEVRKGSWGVFTDLMYLDLGATKSAVRNFAVGGVGLPADVSAHASLDVKSTVWTLAGTYGVIAGRAVNVDVFAGARLNDVKQKLDWNLNGNIALFPLPSRAGTLEVKEHVIDGIVGAKGKAAFGEDLKWFVPYYVDVGTGDSDLTWQIFGGLGHAFKWGDLIAGWRYLDYKFRSDAKINTMTLDGPMIGGAFHW